MIDDRKENNMKYIVIKVIATIIILTGAVFIYDARLLSEKWFGFGDQNQATAGLKILGFIFAIIGAVIIL